MMYLHNALYIYICSYQYTNIDCFEGHGWKTIVQDDLKTTPLRSFEITEET